METILEQDMEYQMTTNGQQTATENAGKPRKPYHKPHLQKLRDLRSLTLGGSFGCGESGSCARKVRHSFVNFGGTQPTIPNQIPTPGVPAPGQKKQP
jgi:hypothetical protein